MNICAKRRFEQTMFVVEANSFEHQALWERYNGTNGPLAWDWVASYSATVGELDGRPIAVSLRWDKINDRIVLFWYAMSEVVDYQRIQKFLESQCSPKWDGDRPAFTDAENFHNVIIAIKEMNNPTVEKETP